MKHAQMVGPMLLAVAPVLHVAAGNFGQFTRSDLLFTIAFYAALAVLITAACLVALRRRLGTAGALTVATIAVAWICYYPIVRDGLRQVRWGLGRHELLIPPMLVASGVAAWLVNRRSQYAERFMAFVTVLGLAAVAITWADLGRHRMEGDDPRTRLAEQLARPVPTRAATAAPSAANRRDVWVIVPDGYARQSVLGEEFGFDNHVFIDSLRALGFVVPADVRSNYQFTVQSLPSLLNFAYVTPISDEIDSASEDPRALERLLDDSRLRRFLRDRGYRVYLFRNWWSTRLRRLEGDWVFDAWNGQRLAALIGRTELRRTLWNQTLPGLVIQAQEVDEAARLRRIFSGLEDLADVRGPKFVFAHIMVPHGPYYVGADCSALPEPIVYPGDRAEEGRLYVDTVRCLNILVQRILARPATAKPIIIIQGDHGSRMSARTDVTHGDARYFRSVFGAFGAYYLPAGGAKSLRRPVTVVNVMRSVLNGYFGADLPMLPDSFYTADRTRPFEFIPVRAQDVWGSAPEGDRSGPARTADGRAR